MTFILLLVSIYAIINILVKKFYYKYETVKNKEKEKIRFIRKKNENF